MRALLIALLLLLPLLPASAQQLGNYTNMSIDPQHGTQITYYSGDGRTFLWYPGNDVILEGRYRRNGDSMCFAYGGNTYNPATGQAGGGWECMPFDIYWWVVHERVPGDIFGLEGRTAVPFVLGKGRTTLEKLLARAQPGARMPPLELATHDAHGNMVSQSCANILANAERSKADMAAAVPTVFHGRYLGKPCGEPDYYRAYDLAQRAGISFEPWANTLRERAAFGLPDAIRAVERLGL